MARLKSLIKPRERSGSVTGQGPRAHFPAAQRRESVELERSPNCLLHRSAEDCDCEKVSMPLASSYQAGQMLRRRFIERSGSSRSAAASTGRASTGMASSRYSEEVCDEVSEFTAEAAAARFLPTKSSTEAASNSTRSTESSASARRREFRLKSKDCGIKTAGTTDNDFYRAGVSLAGSSLNDALVTYYASSVNPLPSSTTSFLTDEFPPRTPNGGKQANMLPMPASRPEGPIVPLASPGERSRARQAGEASLASPALGRASLLKN
ncbi:hypothetical protein T484DRAFT_1811505 [Baffinella frigidus]|nr:hypothetical protein T484DRAFT_1811505 [Cryptophyta sp. CCMP2293]